MVYKFGPYELRRADLVLLEDGAPLALGPKVVATLLVLVESAGETVSKDELISRVWPDGFAMDGSVSQNIHILRKIFRARLGCDLIETLPRRGYRFVEPSKSVSSEPVRNVSVTPDIRRFLYLAVAIAAIALAALFSTRGHGGVPPLSPKAQQLYAIGRLHLESRNPARVAESVSEFSRAIELDPQNPLAYGALAEAYTMQTFWCVGRSACERQTQLARQAAGKALHYGMQSAEAHTAAAFVLTALDNDERQGEAEFRKAIQLNPKYPAAHLWYGNLLLKQAKFTAAASELEQAAVLEPRAALAPVLLGRAYLYSARYRDAIAIENTALQLDAHNSDAYITLGISYDALGEHTAAKHAFEHIHDRSALGRERVLIGRELALLGDRRIATSIVGKQPDLPRRESFVRDWAALEVALGNKSAAIARLRRLRGAALAFALADPRLRGIRDGLLNGKMRVL